MICFKCSGEEFATKLGIIRQVFRGETLDVKTPVSVCTACGWQTLARGQTDELRKRTADAYREKRSLLTSTTIKLIRQMKGVSQVEFAAFLDVGVASVKRWETGLVQEKVYDQLIRQKCATELNAIELRDKWKAALSGTEWITISISLLPVAAFAQFTQKLQAVPVNSRFVPSADVAQRRLWSGGEEDNVEAGCLISENEKLALAA